MILITKIVLTTSSLPMQLNCGIKPVLLSLILLYLLPALYNGSLLRQKLYGLVRLRIMGILVDLKLLCKALRW